MSTNHQVVRIVEAEGNLLNDNDAGVDHLEQGIYAEAICDSIHNVETPITIGLFARWGSGKTFLVKHIQSILRKNQLQKEIDNEANRNSCRCPKCKKTTTIILILIFLAIAILSLLLIMNPKLFNPEVTTISPPIVTTLATTTQMPNGTTQSVAETTTAINPYVQTTKSIQIAGIAILGVLLAFVLFITCWGRNLVSSSYYGQFKILIYSMFTKIPVATSNASLDVIGDPGESMDHALQRATTTTSPGTSPEVIAQQTALDTSPLPRKYIFATFRAWEFAGSDSLWAGIITNISDALEREFGIVTTRLFRTINVETINREELLTKENDGRIIYIKLDFDDNEETAEIARNLSMEYGVVKRCVARNNSWFEVEYSKIAEARSAFDSMKIRGIDVRREMPDEAHSITTAANLNTNDNHNSNEGDATDSHATTPFIEHSRQNKSRNQGRHTPTPAATNEDQLKENINATPGFWTYFSRHPALLCRCPYLFWIVLFFVIIILIPIVLYLLTIYLDLRIVSTYREVSVAAQVLLWLPGSLSVVFVGIRFIWAMFASQRNRVQKALDGVKANMAAELGFMSKVKDEVAIMTKLLQCANFVMKKDYKVVITIDDLDRVQLNRVKSVLEAISILLSDKASPFICLVAVDSRVAVKCIEQDMGEALVKANVTGHEYIKKIINLPVCLPQVENTSKKRFIAGLIDQADKTTKKRKEQEDVSQQSGLQIEISVVNPPNIVENADDHVVKPIPIPIAPPTDGVKRGRFHLPTDSPDATPTPGDDHDGSPQLDNRTKKLGPDPRKPTKKLVKYDCTLPYLGDGHSAKDFLFECRNEMVSDTKLHSYLEGSPRNIKRIFNIISLTAGIIKFYQQREERRSFYTAMRKKNEIQEINQQENSRTEDDAQPNSTEPRPTTEQIETKLKNAARDLVRWAVLADQWPFRTSYMLEVIEDNEQRSEADKNLTRYADDMPLIKIYKEHVLPELHGSDEGLLSLDGDPDILVNFLAAVESSGPHKGRVAEFAKWTVNLDRSLRQSVAVYRERRMLLKVHEDNEAANAQRPILLQCVHPPPQPAAHEEEEQAEEIREQVNRGYDTPG